MLNYFRLPEVATADLEDDNVMRRLVSDCQVLIMSDLNTFCNNNFLVKRHFSFEFEAFEASKEISG